MYFNKKKVVMARKFGWLNLKWYLYLSECNNEVRIQGKCCQCSTYCEKGNCSSFS